MKKTTKQRRDRKPTTAKRRKPPAHPHGSIMELHARTWAAWKRAAQGVEKSGGIVRVVDGKPTLSPALVAYVELAKILRGTLNDLGMTPAAAARVGAGRGH